MNVSRRSILISGASSGIGRCCALTLAEYGYFVFAGVRKDADADELLKASDGRIVPIMLDVTNPGSICTVVERMQHEGLYALVNNAGTALLGPMEFLPLEKIRQQFDVNFFGHLAVTQAVLPLLRGSSGRIVNISSLSGYVAFPFAGAYAASKFALEAWSDALRRELHDSNIKVSVIEPGNIRTPIWDKSSHLSSSAAAHFPAVAEEYYGNALVTRRRDVSRMLEPAAVARVVLAAIQSKRPKPRYVVGRDARFYSIVRRMLSDSLLDRLIRSRM